ncbi:MAG: DUF2877 domain-containing protein [Propionibacteriaceae bacterium]|nr:DUF2877 domain-containing protein [Propionibacteriaceae bacterium]
MVSFNEDLLSALVVPAGPPPWLDAGQGTTVHVGQSLCLLRRPDGRLLPLTRDDHGLVPGGIMVPSRAEFAALSAAATAGGLDLTRLRAARSILTRDLRIRPGMLDRRAARLALRMLPEDPPVPQRRLAAGLVRALAAPGRPGLDTRLLALVGAGPGSTPSGDDILVGVLAVMHRSGPAGEAALAALRSELPRLLRRTTMTSRHLLAAALDGMVADRVHEVLAGLAEVEAVPGLLRAARGWGATSGLDLVAGAATAIAGGHRMFGAGPAGEAGREKRVA